MAKDDFSRIGVSADNNLDIVFATDTVRHSERNDRDYDGRVLSEGEVLVPFPFNELDAANVVNPGSIRVYSIAGHYFKAVMKAVPVEYAKIASESFNTWVNDQLPARRDGRCLVPQPDGGYKECPKKRGGNRCSCAECPHRGEYEKANKSNVSIDALNDEFDFVIGTTTSAEELYTEEERREEECERVRKILENLIERSPKHALAFLLMQKGLKGEAFAEKLRISKPCAGVVRRQIMDCAPIGITRLEQADLSSLKANKSKWDSYYREEAMEALNVFLRNFD